MKIIFQRQSATIRSFGYLLTGFGIGLLFFAAGWLGALRPHELLLLGMFIIAISNFLRAAKSKEEKAKESLKQREKYARITKRFGADRIRFAHRISIAAMVILFLVAMSIMLLGSMDYVWPLIGIIVVSMIIAALTVEPRQS